jgi:hypothetical protein
MMGNDLHGNVDRSEFYYREDQAIEERATSAFYKEEFFLVASIFWSMGLSWCSSLIKLYSLRPKM